MAEEVKSLRVKIIKNAYKTILEKIGRIDIEIKLQGGLVIKALKKVNSLFYE